MHTRARKIADRWWAVPDTQVHGEVFATANHIRTHSQDRRRADMHHMRLYGNLDVAGAGHSNRLDRMRYNLCSSAVDTAASLIAQQRPKPQYLTQDGDWGMQRQARLRTRVLEAQLYDLDAYEIMPQVFIDAAVLGTGCVYGYVMDGEPRLERVLPMELLVDHHDGLAGAPRCLYRRRLISRELLAELYPDHVREVAEAQGPSSDDRGDFWLSLDTTSDQVVVIEAWHLPSGANAKDGKRAICTSAGTLVTEAHDCEHFPFAFYRWKKRQIGFWGMGIVEECRDAQVRINQIIARVEELQKLGANAWLLVDRHAGVRVEKVTNQPLSMIVWDSKGVRPEFQAFNPTPPELQNEIASIREQTFSQLGLSTLTAEGRKPAGLDSGAAQRAYDDIQSRRHVMNARGYESAYMDVVSLIERLNEEVGGDMTVATRNSRGRSTMISEVKWSEVSLPENKYRMTMFPTSALPSTPAGKMAYVSEWIDRGFVSRPFGMSLLDFPDIDAAARMELADLDAVMYDVEMMLDGKAAYPEPYQDLQLAADTARRAYLHARTNGAPDDVLELIREYVEDCRQQLQAAQPAPVPAPMPDAMVAPELPAPEMAPEMMV